MEKMPKKESRKTRYTRAAIRDSLIELMKQRPITDIAIKEICALADVSRPTFYAHYRDKYDLLQSIEDETSAYFENIIFANGAKKLSKREIVLKFKEVFQYIDNNSNSVQVLLSENGDIGFQRKIFRQFIARFQNIMTRYSEKKLDEKKNEYYAVFIVHGIISMVHHWLKSGMDIPKDELPKMIVDLIVATGVVPS